MSHTPGPWKVIVNPVRGVIVKGPNGVIIASHPLCKEWKRNEELYFNARLIAAAPELLECLEHIQGIVSESQGVAGWHQNGQVASWDELGLREEIDGVLAKAGGEESE